ncbi:hypothetical protein LR48_Vigan01g186700 [Vigna angularis]|uniref:Protein phosphatase n=1 Tax=Phaseolus angularis TaxID=3914 RepID=A0A0L9TPB4_PHAAN|nr:hypothetical protein LR48_Vigan01g186700 [Vigna angularis]
MAASTSNAVLLGDVYFDEVTAKPSGVRFRDRTRRAALRATVNLTRLQPLNSLLNFGCSTSNSTWRSWNPSSLLVGTKRPSFPCCSADTAPHVQHLSSSTFSLDQTNFGPEKLKLFSGSCYLPHPDKEDYGGEDAHFICVDEQTIGVADGVGGWADVGVNAGLFAQELMSHSVRAVEEEPKGSVDPASVLEKAHSFTKAKGSSTACIISLSDTGLHAINLGDSGFIVIRDGCTIFRSPVQQHDFNFTYQLESGNGCDLPSSGEPVTCGSGPSLRATANHAGFESQFSVTRRHAALLSGQSVAGRRPPSQFRPVTSPAGDKHKLRSTRLHALPSSLQISGACSARAAFPVSKFHRDTSIALAGPPSLCSDLPEQPLLPSSSVFVSAVDCLGTVFRCTGTVCRCPAIVLPLSAPFAAVRRRLPLSGAVCRCPTPFAAVPRRLPLSRAVCRCPGAVCRCPSTVCFQPLGRKGNDTAEVERIRGSRWCDGKMGIKGGETFWLQAYRRIHQNGKHGLRVRTSAISKRFRVGFCVGNLTDGLINFGVEGALISCEDNLVLGDVVVAGTDGLFDNLYNDEVAEVVLKAVRAGLEPQVTAQKIAALARQRALDRNRQTPFATAAQEAGFRYYGGKLDDITVIVSYITGSTYDSPSWLWFMSVLLQLGMVTMSQWRLISEGCLL